MFPPLRTLAIIPVYFLVLTTIPIRQGIVHAQSHGNATSNNYPYFCSGCYHWLTPGRIVGIAIGALALILLVLALLISLCRRRRHAKSVTSNFSGQLQPLPPLRTQQPGQTPYGLDATNMGWYYPAQGTPPFVPVKSTVSSGQAQRTTPEEQLPGMTPAVQASSSAPFGELQRSLPSDQVQKPVPKSQAVGSATSGQLQTTAPLERVPNIEPKGRTQRTTPLIPAWQRSTPVPPPPHACTKGTLSAGPVSGRDRSPPPYYPPTSPPTPTHTVR